MEIIEDSPIIQRLKAYIEYVGLSTTQFADKASIPRPTFSQLLRGRNKTINNQILGKLNDSFPDLNILWLLFGQGNMRISANIKTSESQNTLNGTINNSQYAEMQDIEGRSFRNLEQQQIDKVDIQASLFDNMGPAEAFDDEKFGAFKEAVSKKNIENPKRKISSIVVFYSDNSFQTYLPES